MVQLTDVILGATRQCLDATSQNRRKTEVARHFLPLVWRMTDPDQHRNPRGRHGQGGRCTVSFFPKHGLTREQLEDPHERGRANLYVRRRPALLDTEQLSLELG